MSPLQQKPFFENVKEFASGEDSPRDFLERCIEQYVALEPKIGAFVCVNLDRARNAADFATERWRQNRPLSPIDGIPVGIKDIIETWDMPTQMGSPLFDNWHSGRDAASVAALREAGAVIFGKTVTTEFASTEPRGTRNPWDPNRTPGGSSSGSAASVTAGMVSAALGTQVVGSIVRPAGYCGCVGYKPTLGAINRGGSHDYLSQSCTGTLAATLSDAWVVAREIAARVGGDPGFVGLQGSEQPPVAARPRRLGLFKTSGWPAVDQDCRSALEAVTQKLSSAGVEIADEGTFGELAELEVAIKPAYELTRNIQAYEQRWPLNTYREHDRGGLSPIMLNRLAKSEKMTGVEYEELLAARTQIREKYSRLKNKCDALITLSASGIAPMGLRSSGDPGFAVPASLLGAPTISLPVMTVSGMPLGLQIIGFERDDAALFGISAWIAELLQPQSGQHT